MLANAHSPCDEGIIQAQRKLPRTVSAAPPSSSEPASAAAETSRTGCTLAATVLGSSMAFIDGSVVNIALPAIQHDFANGAGGNLAAMQWIINAYLLALGVVALLPFSLMVGLLSSAAGQAMERFGARR